jgi:hypothetical protein
LPAHSSGLGLPVQLSETFAAVQSRDAKMMLGKTIGVLGFLREATIIIRRILAGPETSLSPLTVVIPAASSRSITGISGILGHPPSRVTTVESVERH